MTKATENVSINMNTDLIELLDAYCQRKDLHRSQVISRAVRMFIAVDASRDCDFISLLYQRHEGNSK